MMRFINPSLLWLLCLLPPLAVAAVWLGWQRNKRLLVNFGEVRLIARHSQLLTARRAFVRAVAAFLALGLALVALARPALEHGDVTVRSGTVDVVAVVDVSRSMAIESYAGKTEGPGTRLDMARSVLVTRLMPSLGANKLGIVSYAGDAVQQGFITTDMKALSWVANHAITIGGAPGDGTTVTSGLTAALQELELDSPEDHARVVVLFTDGDFYDEPGELARVTSALKKSRIQLIIVGLGNAQAQPIPVIHLPKADQYRLSKERYFVNAAGQVERLAFNYQNVNNLKNMASARYIHIEQASDFDISELLKGAAVTHKRGSTEIFWVPLSLSVVFVLLNFVAQRERRLDWRKLKQLIGGLMFRRAERRNFRHLIGSKRRKEGTR